MKQKKLIYLWITQSLNVLFCVFLLILIVLWSRQRFFFFSKYNGTQYYHLDFYLIHSFLLVSIFFIFGHKIFILSKYWKNKIKDNFWTWFLIIVPFLDLFILKKDPNLDTINNDSFSNAKFRGFLFWLLPLISLILIYICFSINSMAYSFERTPYLNVSNSLEAEAKEITWIPWDGFFDFTLPNLSLDIYKTIPQYIICLLCSVLINLTFWNLIKPIFRLDFKLWKKTQIENTNTKKYFINTQLLNLMVLIFVLLLVFFEILWVQRDLKNWHALNYLHHWTSFYKHFQYYPEMLLYIIDYRAYNMITTFLMVSAIAIYLFRCVVLYKYWQKTTSKRLLKFIFILIPFLDMLFLNIYSINDINEKPFKDRKWKFKWILILLAVVISISLIYTFMKISPYNLKWWQEIDPFTYRWSSGAYDLKLNKFIPNYDHIAINIKTILAISGYISFIVAWSLIYMSIFSLLKSEFKLSTLNQTNK